MAIPNVPSLSSKIKPGSQGGLEFAQIMNQLLDFESRIQDYRFISSSDASGDYKGCDAIFKKGDKNFGVQYKFMVNGPNSNQKSEIKKSLKNAIQKFPEMDEWVLVTPDDFKLDAMNWLSELESEFSMKVNHWGQIRINNLMLFHKELCQRFYPEFLPYIHEFKDHDPTDKQINEYFNQFNEPEADWNSLFYRAQPTYVDIKKIFEPKHYKEITEVISFVYRDLFESDRLINETSIKEQTFTYYSSNLIQVKNGPSELPGGIKNIVDQFDCFLPNVKIYGINFHNKNDNLGIFSSVWFFVNGRWVFVPKPWRYVPKIYQMHSDKTVKRLVWIIKLFAGKSIKSNRPYETRFIANHLIHKILDSE